MAWWTETTGAMIGAYGGAGAGVLGGLYGGICGPLAGKGIGRPVILPLHMTILAAGIASLLTGIVAVASGQPYHVWYPLVLLGGVMTSVMTPLLFVVRKAYAQAENRRLAAEEIRRG